MKKNSIPYYNPEQNNQESDIFVTIKSNEIFMLYPVTFDTFRHEVIAVLLNVVFGGHYQQRFL
jgi:hypothetical protein